MDLGRDGRRTQPDGQRMSDAMVPCFKCGMTLLNVFPDADNQPSSGTEFSTYGHYGSTFWDSFDGLELVLNICDACLRTHADRLATRKKKEKRTVDYEMTLLSGGEIL